MKMLVVLAMAACLWLGALWAVTQAEPPPALPPQSQSRLESIPDKLVVLTFDDSKASHYTVVRPLLKKYNFGATFWRQKPGDSWRIIEQQKRELSRRGAYVDARGQLCAAGPTNTYKNRLA